MSEKSVFSDDVQGGTSRDVRWRSSAGEGRLSCSAGQSFGRYRLEELVGRGGMAEVWRAVDTKLDRAVALKVILTAYVADRGFVERFLREARVVASLEHPNILPVYDAGEEGSAPFLVMPYLEGGTLRDGMASGPAPLAKSAAWIGQLAGALDAAHEAGVLHRDVKPANVLLGKGDRLFLADFGIARTLESSAGLTATGMVMGTPLYMAPEQAQGHPATPATDRYALAVIAYELLAGRPPFEGESALSLMHQHVTTPAPALSTRVSGLPPGLDAVFAKALAKDPTDRHRTCAEFAGAVALYVPAGVSGAASRAPAVSVAPTVVQAPHRLATVVPLAVRREDAAPRTVATSPPGLSSEETILTEERPRRRKPRPGAVAALAVVSAVAGGLFLMREKERATFPGGGDAKPVATSPHVPPPAETSKGKTPDTVSLQRPQPPTSLGDSSIESEPGTGHEPPKPSKVGERGKAGAPPPNPLEGRAPAAASKLPAGVASASPPASSHSKDSSVPPPPLGGTGSAQISLVMALKRLDPSLKPDHRLSKEDFEWVQGAASEFLGIHPDKAEARLLEIYSAGGLEYVARNDEAASQALVEAFAFSRRAIQRDIARLAFVVRGPGGAILPPKGWELALAYGDARGEAERLLGDALARRPNDVRALIGRAHLRRIEGRTTEFLADLRRALEANPAPAVRKGVQDQLGTACGRGLQEACAEAERLEALQPAPKRRPSLSR